MANAKDLILGDPQKLENFEACQQYLKTLVYNKTTQEKHERQVSGLQQGLDNIPSKDNNSNKSKNTNGKRPSGNDGRGGKVVARQYTKAEWAKLTPEQRAKVKELRSNKRRKSPGNRNASSAQTDESGMPPSAEITPPVTAHTILQVTTLPSVLRGGVLPPTASRSVRFAEGN